MGAEINTIDKEHEAPLHKAAKCERGDVSKSITLLVEKGPDPNLINNDRKTYHEIFQRPLEAYPYD